MLGSTALGDVLGGAAGRLDGYFEDRASRWDWAAKSLIARGMAKSFGKSVHDQSLGMFARVLEAKCARYGRTYVTLDRFFPSTQLCSHCGELTGPKGKEGLRIRTWTCHCGTTHDRDRNAEYNLRLEGRRIVAEGRPDT